MKILFLLSTLFIFLVSFSQDKKPLYHKFKKGTFYSTHLNEKGEQDTLIIRRDGNVQTESSLQNGEEKVLMTLKVIWVSDSKYILRSIKHINNSKSFIIDDVMCKIVETGDNYYVVKGWAKKGKKN